MNSKIKIWKLVSTSLILLTLMLFPVIASAKVDIKIDNHEDSIKFDVKNIGKVSTYLPNSLIILNDKGKIIYTSHDPSSAEILKISPDKLYTFEWNIENIADGKYTAKIYQGDNKKKLEAVSIEFRIEHKSGKLILYTDETFYNYRQSVDITLKNLDKFSIYVNVNNWKITDLHSKKVVRILSHDCTFGYGGCADLFEKLNHDKYIEQIWDQKDSKGKQVNPGSYVVTAEYSTKEHPSKKDIKTISTKTFYIGLRGDLNNNGVSADAGDLVLMKRASIGEFDADSRYDLNNNGQFADAGDLVLMKRASIGEIIL